MLVTWWVWHCPHCPEFFYKHRDRFVCGRSALGHLDRVHDKLPPSPQGTGLPVKTIWAFNIVPARAGQIGP